MVRRRSKQTRIEDSAPGWVLTFTPDQWPGTDWPHRWNNWRAAVREFATDSYKDTDICAWLHVMCNVYATKNKLWADLARERTEGNQHG